MACVKCDADSTSVKHVCEKCGKSSRAARKGNMCTTCESKQPGHALWELRNYFERRYRRGKFGVRPSRSQLWKFARIYWDSLSPRAQNLLRKDLRVHNFNNQDPFESVVDYAQMTIWAVAADVKRHEAKKKKQNTSKDATSEAKKSSASVWTVSGGLPTLGKN